MGWGRRESAGVGSVAPSRSRRGRGTAGDSAGEEVAWETERKREREKQKEEEREAGREEAEAGAGPPEGAGRRAAAAPGLGAEAERGRGRGLASRRAPGPGLWARCPAPGARRAAAAAAAAAAVGIHQRAGVSRNRLLRRARRGPGRPPRPAASRPRRSRRGAPRPACPRWGTPGSGRHMVGGGQVARGAGDSVRVGPACDPGEDRGQDREELSLQAVDSLACVCWWWWWWWQ